MTIRIIDWPQFTEEQQNLIAHGLEKNTSISMSPMSEFLRKNGISPSTDTHGEIIIPNIGKTLRFWIESLSDGRGYIMTMQPMGKSESDADKALRSVEKQQYDLNPVQIRGITMDVPEFFEDEGFLNWLNNDEIKFAQHVKGDKPDEWSEVIVTVDPGLEGDGGEASNANFPEWCWEVIAHEARRRMTPDTSGEFIYLVCLVNKRD